MLGLRVLVLGMVTVSGFACVPSVPPLPPGPKPAPQVVEQEDPGVDIAAARALKRDQGFTWSPWTDEAFARARRDDKLILIHGAATWCHWCHVMEETTYRDPEVGALIAERFVAIRVDIDARPDIEERYADWGWPATIVLSPAAEELAKLRGYVPADRMRGHLRELLKSPPEVAAETTVAGVEVASLPDVYRQATAQLDRLYDRANGSWGRRQKVPLGAAAEHELMRGSAEELARAERSLDGHAQLIDPVWGGIYQYSTDGDWSHPHFEKLMTYQAENISAFARGYAVLGQPRHRRHAEAIVGYVNRFLSNGDGAFFVTQDADLGGFEHGAAFVDGHRYYALSESERWALGVPRVDDNVYAEENGLAIAAYADLLAATGDAALRVRVMRAADLMLSSHVGPAGGVAHDAERPRVKYLADAAALGHGLARLYEETHEARYREAALRIVAFLEAELRDEATGAYWAHTPDDAAAGVFARRRRPFDANARVARFLAAIHRVTGEPQYQTRAQEVLAAIAGGIRAQGRMVGDYLLALREAGIELRP